MSSVPANIHRCKSCGCLGHKTTRHKQCLVRKENTFEVGSRVALSLPWFSSDKADNLQHVLWEHMHQNHGHNAFLFVSAFHFMKHRRCFNDLVFAYSHEPIEGSKERQRYNVNAAHILSFKDGKYIVRLKVLTLTKVLLDDGTYYRRHPYTETEIVLSVPVFFEGKRLLFPLKSTRWELPRSMIAECRAYYNRGHAKIRGKGKLPKFEDTSWRKGETAKDKEAAWISSNEYKKECKEEKKLMRKMCLLPDELFREVMEFAYPKPL